MSKKLALVVDVDAKTLATALADARDYNALFRLIEDIDAQMADWDFTERLYAYFAKQHELYLAEVATDAAENK